MALFSSLSERLNHIFSKLTKLSPKKTYFALGTLQAVGAVVRLGKRGNAYVYERAPATGEKED